MPKNERIAFGFEYPDHYAPGSSPAGTLLCGYDDDADDRVDIELGHDRGGNSPCEGGTVYVVDQSLPKGATIHYRFNRRKASERFVAGTAVLNQDTVIGAVYTFPCTSNNSPDTPSGMPNTGAGGSHTGPSWMGTLHP